MYHSFLIHSSADGHLGCFHVLTRIERDTCTPMFITALFIIARSFLMGETDWGGNWILFWWAGPCSVQFSSVQSLSHVRLFVTPCTTVPQASLSITNSRSLLKLMSTESVMPSNHLYPLLSPSLPAFNLSQHQGFFKCQSFPSGGQSIGVSASASVLPMNIQDWFPLR